PVVRGERRRARGAVERRRVRDGLGGVAGLVRLAPRADRRVALGARLVAGRGRRVHLRHPVVALAADRVALAGRAVALVDDVGQAPLGVLDAPLERAPLAIGLLARLVALPERRVALRAGGVEIGGARVLRGAALKLGRPRARLVALAGELVGLGAGL